MENQVTRLVENAVSSLPGIEQMSSNVQLGVSSTVVQFAIGSDYRKWDYDYINDHMNGSSTFVSQIIGVFPQGDTHAKLSTREVYGELLVPIVKGLPLVQEFNLELGGRYSDYSTSGGVSTYKILGDWVVTPWARLRGGYNRATRAPHLAEQFLGLSQRTTSVNDPCSRNQSSVVSRGYSANPVYNANAAQVEALCRALMTTQAASTYYGVPLAQQPGAAASITTSFMSGNTSVQPETAHTYTAGLVLRSPFQNAWVSGLGATIDWYSIRIKDIIAEQGLQEVWRACVATNDATSAECGIVGRDPFDGRASLANLTYTNRGSLKFQGVDLALNWRARFSELGFESIPGMVSFNTQVTIPTKRWTQDGDTIREWKGTNGCAVGVVCSGYKYQAFTTLTYSTGPMSVSGRWNYYPTIKDASAATDPATKIRGVFESYNLLSLAGSYEVSDSLTVRMGIDNLFDVRPPLTGGSYAADGTFNTSTAPNLPIIPTASGDARYDQLGRRMYVGVDISL